MEGRIVKMEMMLQTQNLCKYFIKQNTHVGRTKKRYHDSRRSTVTTQTQNKTRQNYYAIFPVYAGEA